MTKTEITRIYLDEETKSRAKQKAEANGLSLSAWIRSKIKEELPAEATA